MSAQSSIRDMFFEEAEELLEALAEGLSAMHGGDHGDETVNAVFRAVHSIKGGAGAFKLTALVAFAHRFETVLDEVRAHRLAIDPDLMHTLQRSSDHLADLVEEARDGNDGANAQTADFVSALDACLGGAPVAEPVEDEDGNFGFAAITIELDDLGGGDAPAEMPAAVSGHQFTIRFRPHAGLYTNGHDPALLIATLADLGEVEAVPDLSRLPGLAEYDPARPSLGWELRLATGAALPAVQEVFEFVDGLCDLDIQAEAAAPPAASADAPAEEEAVLPMEEVEEKPAPATVQVDPGPSAAMPGIGRDAAAGEAASEKSGPKPTLRVDLDRVDRLINAVGELIINQSMIAQ